MKTISIRDELDVLRYYRCGRARWAGRVGARRDPYLKMSEVHLAVLSSTVFRLMPIGRALRRPLWRELLGS